MNSMYESIVLKDMKGVWHCLLAGDMAGESGCKSFTLEIEELCS